MTFASVWNWALKLGRKIFLAILLSKISVNFSRSSSTLSFYFLCSVIVHSFPSEDLCYATIPLGDTFVIEVVGVVVMATTTSNHQIAWTRVFNLWMAYFHFLHTFHFSVCKSCGDCGESHKNALHDTDIYSLIHSLTHTCAHTKGDETATTTVTHKSTHVSGRHIPTIPRLAWVAPLHWLNYQWLYEHLAADVDSERKRNLWKTRPIET